MIASVKGSTRGGRGEREGEKRSEKARWKRWKEVGGGSVNAEEAVAGKASSVCIQVGGRCKKDQKRN